MIKNLLKICLLLIIFILLISGCSTSLKNEINVLSSENAALKEKNISLENTIINLNNQINEQKSKIDELAKPAFDKSENMYPIYTADSFTLEKEIAAYIYIPKETVLKKKLQIIAEALSETYFENLPIEVLRIEEINKKKIAFINLKEYKENKGIFDIERLKGKTWMAHYMQGSTGGSITSTAFIETFLQREYIGQWVDGFKFLYENTPCDFEHARLRDIVYR